MVKNISEEPGRSPLGAALRELRIKKDLSQAELADGCCSPGYVSQIEEGHAKNPSVRKLSCLSEKVGVDPQVFMALRETTKHSEVQIIRMSPQTVFEDLTTSLATAESLISYVREELQRLQSISLVQDYTSEQMAAMGSLRAENI